MNKFLLFLRSILAYLVIGLAIGIAILPCFFIACLPARWRYDNRVYYWFSNLLYKACVFSMSSSITIKGKENIPKEPAIFVANHESALDMPVFGSILDGAPHVWLFYVRYAKIPVVGFIFRRMNVVIDPSGLRKLVGSLEKTVDIVKDKKSNIMIFPEGGRFNDGQVHNFFYGFAILAKDTKRPVVPVMLYNLGNIYPPGTFLIRNYPIEIVIGKPFIFKSEESDQDFVQRVHAWFLEHTRK